MAGLVQLVKHYDGNSAVTSTLNLYGGAHGIRLARNGWRPVVVAPGGSLEPVKEVMRLQIEGSDHDNLAAREQALMTKLREAQEYQDSKVEVYGIWLRDKLPDETGTRQAFIKAGSLKIGETIHSPPVSPGNFLSNATLTLKRMPFWENLNLSTISAGGISGTGGSYDYSSVGGDVGARIMQTIFKGATGWTGPLYEFWMGFRTDRFGDRANFEPVWECEDGTNGTDSSDAVDATASAGNKVTCDFGAEEDMVARVTVAVEDVTADYTDQRGEFAVLLRAKVGASTTCRVRLLDNFASATTWRTQGRVEVSSTSWKLYPVGSVSIPPLRGSQYLHHNKLRNYSLRIEAERASGSNDLDLDCFILIPTAEKSLYFAGGNVRKFGSITYPATIYITPEGLIYGDQADAGSMPTASIKDIDAPGYELPVGDGTLYLAAQREASHVLTDGCGIILKVLPRWSFLRGSS